MADPAGRGRRAIGQRRRWRHHIHRRAERLRQILARPLARNGIIAFGDESTAYPGGKSQFYRENLFEYARVTRSNARVSRLNCSLRSSPENMQLLLAGLTRKGCYEVLPADPDAAIGRHEMGWMDWVGVPGRTPGEVIDAIERYWHGDAAPKTDLNGWERLSSSGLQVVGRIA